MRIARDLVRVVGPEARSFLQGQLSQDVEQFAIGSSAWALLLEPQGKVDAFLRITRSGDDEFVLDVDHGFGGPVVERLDRFKLRTKATIELLGRVGVDVDEGAPPEGALAAFGPATVGATAPDDSGWIALWERVRVRLGIPAMGHELTGDTIPEEAGLVDVAVSFTKGCYTGQELVARIDSRGRNVPRRLRRIIGDDAIDPGAPLVTGDKTVGAVTSASGRYGLGYVARAVEPPASGRAGGTVARIEALPPLR